MASQSLPCGAEKEPLPPGSEPSAAFTPGPWITVYDGGYQTQVRTANGNTAVAFCGLTAWAGNDRPREEANARLIAAAPDGLDTACMVYWKLLTLTEVRHLLQPQLCALRNFIAKATGREPQAVQDEFEAAVLTVADTTDRQPEPRETSNSTPPKGA